MVRAAEPELENDRLFAAVPPTFTLPKPTNTAPSASTGVPDAVEAEETTPEPLSEILIVGSEASLDIVSVPETAPAATGVNVAVKL